MSRTAGQQIHPQFIERHSPRAFKTDPVPQEALLQIFEAARWSPSCFNEQPWMVYYAQKVEDLERLRPILLEGNLIWANKAPVLGFIGARTKFTLNGNNNPWASFDAGQAALAMALQAHHLGLAMHFMGGFFKDKAYETLGLNPEEISLQAAFVIGTEGDKESLPESVREKEVLSGRKNLEEMFFEVG